MDAQERPNSQGTPGRRGLPHPRRLPDPRVLPPARAAELSGDAGPARAPGPWGSQPPGQPNFSGCRARGSPTPRLPAPRGLPGLAQAQDQAEGPAPAEANSPAEVYGTAAHGPEEYDPPDGYPMAEYDTGAAAGQVLEPRPLPREAPDWQHTETADSLTADLLLPGRTPAPLGLAPGDLPGHGRPGAPADVCRGDAPSGTGRPGVHPGRGWPSQGGGAESQGRVGKTTTVMGLGSMLASLRGDRVIAVDQVTPTGGPCRTSCGWRPRRPSAICSTRRADPAVRGHHDHNSATDVTRAPPGRAQRQACRRGSPPSRRDPHESERGRGEGGGGARERGVGGGGWGGRGGREGRREGGMKGSGGGGARGGRGGRGVEGRVVEGEGRDGDERGGQ